MARVIKYGLFIILILSLLTLACHIGTYFPSSKSSQGLELVKEAREIILKNYVNAEGLDKHKLNQGAIRGMVQTLDDPFSAYFTAEQYKLSKTKLQGKFEGIGVKVTLKDGQLTVIAPIPGSPADRAGVRPRDKILEINGDSTSQMSLIEAAMEIRGEKGTKVKLLIQHQGEEKTEELDIMRTSITLDSVFVENLGSGLFKVKITHFSNRTGSELISALEKIRSQGAKGLILDLRNNPGGILNAAVEVASQFLKKGLVAYAEDGKGNKSTWEVKPSGLAQEIPMVVLVNEASASASEIVAGALQDHHRATIIGVKTLGKGSISKVYELSDGSALYLTFAYWFTPNGYQISEKGITPDIVVEQAPEKQLERAIKYLSQKIPKKEETDCRILQPMVS